MLVHLTRIILLITKPIDSSTPPVTRTNVIIPWINAMNKAFEKETSKNVIIKNSHIKIYKPRDKMPAENIPK